MATARRTHFRTLLTGSSVGEWRACELKDMLYPPAASQWQTA